MRAEAMLVAGLVLAGCAGSSGERGSGDAGMSDVLSATVEVKLQGETIRLLLHVTNTGEEAVDFTFPSSQRFEFEVRDGTGAEVWRWSEGIMFTQAITEATLGPGETWEFSAEWEPGNRTGRHEVVGRVTATGRDVQQRMTFDLP
mgnify:CR=1 FL=1